MEARHQETGGRDDAYGEGRMTSPHSKAMSPETRRLQALLNLGQTDVLLQMLVGLGSGPNFSIDIPINLAAHGLLIRGRLTSSEDYAEVLDAYLNRVISVMNFRYRNLTEDQEHSQKQSEDATRQAIAASIGHVFSRRVKRRRAIEELGRDTVEKTWGDASQWTEAFVPRVDDLPDDDIEAALAALSPETVVTLHDAEILPSGSGQWITVGYIRVLSRHVSAWWISPSETAP